MRADRLVALIERHRTLLTTDGASVLDAAQAEQPVIRHNGPDMHHHLPSRGTVTRETWNAAWQVWSERWHPALSALASSRGWQ